MNGSLETPSSPPKTGIRLWPIPIILLLWGGFFVYIWKFTDAIRQEKVIQTAEKTIIAAGLLFLWLAFFSRISWPRRAALLAGVFVLLGAGAIFFKLDSVSGDLVPVIRSRWSKVPGEDLGRENLASDSAPLIEPNDADFPGFLGRNRDGKISGIRLRRDWDAHPPKELWRIAVGAGWSSFAVSGNLAVTQEQRGPQEMVVAYDLESGEEVWRHGHTGIYDNPVGGIGPRATPTIEGQRVYTIGSLGRVNCLDLATGREIWHRDVLQNTGLRALDWGCSSSPLVFDDLVVVATGEPPSEDDEDRADAETTRVDRDDKPPTLIAYRTDTGTIAWQSGVSAAGYSSPQLRTICEVSQILSFNQSSVTAHDPKSGTILWDFPWASQQPNVSQPILLPGDRLLVSSGYSIGSKLLQLTRRADGTLHPNVVWESRRLKAKFTNIVLHNRFAYGLDDGILVCLDVEDGTRKWKAGRYGHGQTLLVFDLLLIQTEAGDVVLVEATPDGHHELSRLTALTSKTWNPPALAGSRLLVRNDREAICFELPVE